MPPRTGRRIGISPHAALPIPGGAASARDAVSFRFVDHTAELQLELEAPTREGVFAEAVAALAEVLGGDGGSVGASRTRELSAQAGDDAALLAAWLEELVFVAETEGLIPRAAERVEVGAHEVRGLVSFVEEAPRHLVKAVTYHDLELGFDGERWRGRAILDV